MKNNPELSIVVPVYNVEAYLPKCLASLFDQGLDPGSFEVLIVNDGSTDNSLGVAENFARQKENVRIHSQQNSGLGAARNVGIKNARGKYLLFMDSDDYLESDRLPVLLNRANAQNLDALRFGYESVNDDGQIIPKSQSADFAVDMAESVASGKEFLATRLGWACYVPMFLFRRSLVAEGPVLFSEGTYFEDVDWLPRVLMQAERVSSVDLLVYYYLRRDGSITLPASGEKRRKLIEDRISVISNIQKLGKAANHRGVELWTRGITALSVIRVLTLAGADGNRPYQTRIIDELKELNAFPLAAPRFNRKQRLNVLIINVSPWLFLLFKPGLNKNNKQVVDS